MPRYHHRLPPEIWRHVCSFLDTPTLVQVERTCTCARLLLRQPSPTAVHFWQTCLALTLPPSHQSEASRLARWALSTRHRLQMLRGLVLHQHRAQVIARFRRSWAHWGVSLFYALASEPLVCIAWMVVTLVQAMSWREIVRQETAFERADVVPGRVTASVLLRQSVAETRWSSVSGFHGWGRCIPHVCASLEDGQRSTTQWTAFSRRFVQHPVWEKEAKALLATHPLGECLVYVDGDRAFLTPQRNLGDAHFLLFMTCTAKWFLYGQCLEHNYLKRPAVPLAIEFSPSWEQWVVALHPFGQNQGPGTRLLGLLCAMGDWWLSVDLPIVFFIYRSVTARYRGKPGFVWSWIQHVFGPLAQLAFHSIFAWLRAGVNWLDVLADAIHAWPMLGPFRVFSLIPSALPPVMLVNAASLAFFSTPQVGTTWHLGVQFSVHIDSRHGNLVDECARLPADVQLLVSLQLRRGANVFLTAHTLAELVFQVDTARECIAAQGRVAFAVPEGAATGLSSGRGGALTSSLQLNLTTLPVGDGRQPSQLSQMLDAIDGVQQTMYFLH